MPKLTNKQIDTINQEAHPFELIFGIDNPHYLPYWVAYMQKLERRQFLINEGSSFLDFNQAMLESSFDWLEWQATV